MSLVLVNAAPAPAYEAAVPSPATFIRANQVGYLPAEPKVAVALSNHDLRGQRFEVIADGTATLAFSNLVGADRGAYGAFAHLYELDFSALTAPGRYRLRLDAETSAVVIVGTRAFGGLIRPTLRFFQAQRCGNTAPLLHGACHLRDGVAAGGPASGTPVVVAGGWHDAGDYLKFLTTSGFALTVMLTSYERHPEAFADDDHNGVPDVLDEARIGLDWLLAMWDARNQVLYYQVGDWTDHYEYGGDGGWRMPELDDVNRPVRLVFACEPGKGANVAGKAAAALAIAASLWGDPARSYFDAALAANYRKAAEEIYAWGKSRPLAQSSTSDPNVPGFVFYLETKWQAAMALAATELYRATGSASYLPEARSYATAAGAAGAFDWSEVGALAVYEIARLDPSYVSSATAFLFEDLLRYEGLSGTNVFRASVTQFGWGCAETMAGAALTALWYEDLSGDARFRAVAQAQRDYLLGGNPWGVCFVNSVGSAWPHHPHHQVADLTRSELVGFWDEGPVTLADYLRQNITLRLPDSFVPFQSDAAVFHDDVADYITNEPTVSMNAAGLALSSWYAPLAPTPRPPRRKLPRG